jgi:hypothetical protein
VSRNEDRGLAALRRSRRFHLPARVEAFPYWPEVGGGVMGIVLAALAVAQFIDP